MTAKVIDFKAALARFAQAGKLIEETGMNGFEQVKHEHGDEVATVLLLAANKQKYGDWETAEFMTEHQLAATG